MKELLLFGSAFGAVFLLGFQSLAVNSGYRALALVNSALIGVMNIGLFKLVPHVETMTQATIYVGAGPLAILCAMEVHAWLRKRKERPAAGLVVYDKDGKQVFPAEGV